MLVGQICLMLTAFHLMVHFVPLRLRTPWPHVDGIWVSMPSHIQCTQFVPCSVQTVVLYKEQTQHPIGDCQFVVEALAHVLRHSFPVVGDFVNVLVLVCLSSWFVTVAISGNTFGGLHVLECSF